MAMHKVQIKDQISSGKACHEGLQQTKRCHSVGVSLERILLANIWWGSVHIEHYVICQIISSECPAFLRIVVKPISFFRLL